MPNARRVVLLEADTINRFSTERILRREDYWVFATDEASAAMRVAAVSAIDLVLVDVGLGRLEAIPRWQRRRGDATFHGVPESVTDGYAAPRLLHVDPSSARFPVVTLNWASSPPSSRRCAGSRSSSCRAPGRASGLVEGLDALFRDLARADSEAEAALPAEWPAAEAERAPAAPTSRPFRASRPRCAPPLVVDPDRRRPPRARRLPRRATASPCTRPARGRGGCALAVARRPWLVITETTPARRERRSSFCRTRAGPQPAATHSGRLPLRAETTATAATRR